MARSRLELSKLIKEAVGSDVSVYFQPTGNITMKFPCVTYERARSESDFANDNPYVRTKRYTLTVIDRNPDSDIPDKIAQLPMCTHSTFFISENLNHDVFDIFF